MSGNRRSSEDIDPLEPSEKPATTRAESSATTVVASPGFGEKEYTDPFGAATPLERHTSNASDTSRNRRLSSLGRKTSLTPAEMHQITQRSNSLKPWPTNTRAGSFESSLHEIDEDILSEILADDEYDPPIATTKCLQQFAKVVSRRLDPQFQEKKRAKLQWAENQRAHHEKTLQQLRKWNTAREKRSTFKGLLSDIVDFKNDSHLPSHRDIVDLAKYHYPPRGEVIIYVCDFGDNRFEKHEVKFKDIDDYILTSSKPDWAIVRWIHAPFDIGLAHSTLEDRFLTVERENVDFHTTNSSWPYAQIETLALRKRSDLEDMRDVQSILRQAKELDLVAKELDESVLEGVSEKITEDLKWRAQHVGLDLNFWGLVATDFQRQLSSGLTLHVDPLRSKLAILKVDPQAISDVPFFEPVQLIRYAFRCFHRSDGCLLTMAAGPGLDYLDRTLQDRLSIPKEAFNDDEDASVIGLMLQLFSKTGTSTWHKKSVEWFLIYLLTEVAASPHNIRQGCNAPNIAKAYQLVVQDLKARRYEKFERNESVKLVRAFLSCIDEVTTLHLILTNTLTMLKNLNQQIDRMEEKDIFKQPDNPEGEDARSRVQWAIAITEEDRDFFHELLVDLRESLQALFQLRSIEQNELAIVADIQNKAILVFTAVTIIFLPLSFFTSYYGMNLQGIVDTQKSERYFWSVCGVSAFVIIMVVSLYAFRHRLRVRLFSSMKTQTQMV